MKWGDQAYGNKSKHEFDQLQVYNAGRFLVNEVSYCLARGAHDAQLAQKCSCTHKSILHTIVSRHSSLNKWRNFLFV